MLVRAYLVLLVMAVLMSAAHGAELEHCPVTENGQAVELAIEKAASCEKAMETFRACAYAASGDVQLGAAVIRRCEADFVNKLSRRQKRTYHQELKRCWLKYGRQPGTIYRSLEAMCAAGVAQAYSRTFQKAGGRKKIR